MEQVRTSSILNTFPTSIFLLVFNHFHWSWTTQASFFYLQYADTQSFFNTTDLEIHNGPPTFWIQYPKVDSSTCQKVIQISIFMKHIKVPPPLFVILMFQGPPQKIPLLHVRIDAWEGSVQCPTMTQIVTTCTGLSPIYALSSIVWAFQSPKIGSKLSGEQFNLQQDVMLFSEQLNQCVLAKVSQFWGPSTGWNGDQCSHFAPLWKNLKYFNGGQQIVG